MADIASIKRARIEPRVNSNIGIRERTVKSQNVRRKYMPKKNHVTKLRKERAFLALFVCVLALFLFNKNNMLAYFTDIKSIKNIFTITAEYTVTFNANTGTGTMDNQTISYNVPTNLTSNPEKQLEEMVTAFSRVGFDFLEWNTKANGSGTTYSNGQEVNNIGNITLYAQWKRRPTRYAVQIYGINQDEDENGNPLGLTFGPATGANYNNAYVTHEYE